LLLIHFILSIGLKIFNNTIFSLIFFVSQVGFCFTLQTPVLVSSAKPQVCELHVFVHGSFGVEFSCLSYPYVVADKIKDTSYLWLQRMLRETPGYQYRRFAGKQGLSEVTSFSSLSTTNIFRHVIGVYDTIGSLVEPKDNHEHRYFAFGWSGLLSQRERRREAIYLYNELAALTASVRASGKTPIIKLYSHSHGCNLVLNLALVDACCFDPQSLSSCIDSDVVSCMNNLLQPESLRQLPELFGSMNAKKIQHWFKKPIIRLEYVDNIVLLGVLVQPETEPLVISPLFKNLLHIYSENDGALIFDNISSKKSSLPFFNPKYLNERPTIKVIRWMNNRTPNDFCHQCKLENKAPAEKLQFSLFSQSSISLIIRVLNQGCNPQCHHPMDPTHQDFWCVDFKRDGAFFEQVPLIVFMPLMHTLLPAAGDAQFLDFCLIGSDSHAQAHLFDATVQDKAHLCATSNEVSLNPVKNARKRILHVLNVNKKLTINVKVKSPFFKKLLKRPLSLKNKIAGE
jgi:hypothetical protein